MDLHYLRTEVLPTRRKEIELGKNLATAQPIYIVYDLIEHAAEGHSEFLSCNTNLQGVPPKFMYIDRDLSEPEACQSDNGMIKPEPVTIFYIDRYRAVFLTSEAAHNYLKYQSHNLLNGYVFVHSSGYSNLQMDNLLKGE